MSTPDPAPQAPMGLEKAVADLEAGNIASACTAAIRLLESHPVDHGVLQFAGNLARTMQHFKDAEDMYRRALAATRDPQQQAMSWAGLALLGVTIGNTDLAEESFRRAMLADPGNIEHALGFAEVLLRRGKLDPALDVQRSTLMRHPLSPQPCVGAGNVLLRMDRQKDALVFYDMALQRDVNYAPAHYNASTALTMLGKLDAARQACDAALKLDPSMAGYLQLAFLGGLKAGDPRLTGLEARLANEAEPDYARVDAGFALGRVYDEAGEADRAFPFLQKANALKRSTLDYDVARDVDRTERIMALFTRDFLQRFAVASDSKLAPIFIVGMPRSGSSLVEQMLAGHPRINAGGELPHMPEIAIKLGEIWGSRGDASPGSDEQLKADLKQAVEVFTRKTAALQTREGRFTDKLPGNFQLIGLIRLMFPEARFIHSRRDPVDTCLSCFQNFFTSDVPYSYDLAELGRYYTLYRRFMAHWHAVLPAGTLLDVDYESLVTEPEAEVRRMLDFCGLPFDPACLDFQKVNRPVTTASAVQVRRPLYTSSIKRWERYRKHLGPLLAELGTPEA